VQRACRSCAKAVRTPRPCPSFVVPASRLFRWSCCRTAAASFIALSSRHASRCVIQIADVFRVDTSIYVVKLVGICTGQGCARTSRRRTWHRRTDTRIPRTSRRHRSVSTQLRRCQRIHAGSRVSAALQLNKNNLTSVPVLGAPLWNSSCIYGRRQYTRAVAQVTRKIFPKFRPPVDDVDYGRGKLLQRQRIS
jgi:hypothetical protein